MAKMLSDSWQVDRVHTGRFAGRGVGDDRMVVLLVEHDIDVAHQLVESFAGQPVELCHCADAAAGLLHVGRGCPDAVVIGPMTTGLPTTEFLVAVQHFDETLPIIVGAGAGSAELAAEATELGAAAVVRRPYPARRLLNLLHSLAPEPGEVVLRPMVIDLGRLKVDGAAPQCWLDGQLIQLPPQEFILLRYFAERGRRAHPQGAEPGGLGRQARRAQQQPHRPRHAPAQTPRRRRARPAVDQGRPGPRVPVHGPPDHRCSGAVHPFTGRSYCVSNMSS